MQETLVALSPATSYTIGVGLPSRCVAGQPYRLYCVQPARRVALWMYSLWGVQHGAYGVPV